MKHRWCGVQREEGVCQNSHDHRAGMRGVCMLSRVRRKAYTKLRGNESLINAPAKRRLGATSKCTVLPALTSRSYTLASVWARALEGQFIGMTAFGPESYTFMQEGRPTRSRSAWMIIRSQRRNAAAMHASIVF